MTSSTPTRDRILDVAMELFSERGFRGTSITQIESAAGLTPGAGGIYHHFRTKDAVLEAGLRRHLDRVLALTDITRLMAGLGDLRTELTLYARYVLAELDREQTLLRVLISEFRSREHLVDDRFKDLLSSSYRGFSGWLQREAGLPREHADPIAVVGTGALLWPRFATATFGIEPPVADDDTFVTAWVTMMMASISAVRTPH